MTLERTLYTLPRWRPHVRVAVSGSYVNTGGTAQTSVTATMLPQERLRWGDMLVARGYSSGFSTVSVGQGWTILAQVVSGNAVFMAYKVFRGDMTPPTFSGPSGRWAVVLHALRVVNPAPLFRPMTWRQPVGTTAVSGSTGQTSLAGGADIDIRPGDIVLQVAVADDDMAAWTRPTNALDAPGVEWLGVSVEDPATHFNSGNNAAPLGNDSACDCVYRIANWASGGSSGAPTLASTTVMARPHGVWGRFRAGLVRRSVWSGLRSRSVVQPWA